ncbi:MAG: hypothetical protein AB7E30_03565 [Lawsonibacter sp.]
MKKYLLTLMIAALLILPMGGAALADSPETASSDALVSEELEYVPGSVPAETDMLQSITPAVHAAVLAMLHHDLAVFDRTDPALGWETLYNMLSLYGQMDDRSEYIGEDLVLPVESVMDFSSALFPSFDTLGQLPADLSDRMVYSPEIDSYQLVCGNDSLAQIQLKSSLRDGDNVELTGSLVYLVDGSDLARFQATLQPSDNMFGYTIMELNLL